MTNNYKNIFIKAELQKWIRILKLPSIELIIWNSLPAPAAFSLIAPTLFINPRKLPNSKAYMIYIVLHEIGHGLYGESEYRADRFAYRLLKKHYPNNFKIVLKMKEKRINQKNYKETNPIGYIAYKRALQMVMGGGKLCKI